MKTKEATLTPSHVAFENSEQMIELLNQQLADLFDLYSQTKYAHWNVRGANFIGLHKLFDELAEKLEDAVDEAAERATALGGIARGTARLAVKQSRLEEFPREVFLCESVVEALVSRYGALSQSTRASIKEADDCDDYGTTDLLTVQSRLLDESIYFLESHLKN